jgi:hypothetical protein
MNRLLFESDPRFLENCPVHPKIQKNERTSQGVAVKKRTVTSQDT